MILIEDKKLVNESKTIRHGFFGRQGGVSAGLYHSLNCGVGSDDIAESVQENRIRVSQQLTVDKGNLVTIHQVHSADCVVVTKPFETMEERPKADGLATDVPGLALGVLTADCGPILLAGEKADGAPVIGAAHAGWGGALKGVGEATVEKMLELGAEAASLRAAIGPCIGPKSYEVSVGFETPFLERNPEDEHFFKSAQKEGHLMFDLPGYIASRLARCGVGQVTITGQDTFAEEENFFSYRRTTHRREPDYGRQISAIAILK